MRSSLSYSSNMSFICLFIATSLTFVLCPRHLHIYPPPTLVPREFSSVARAGTPHSVAISLLSSCSLISSYFFLFLLISSYFFLFLLISSYFFFFLLISCCVLLEASSAAKRGPDSGSTLNTTLHTTTMLLSAYAVS